MTLAFTGTDGGAEAFRSMNARALRKLAALAIQRERKTGRVRIVERGRRWEFANVTGYLVLSDS